MERMGEFLNRVCNGFTPEMIGVKVGEYRVEFEDLKDVYREEQKKTKEDDGTWKDKDEISENIAEYKLDETAFRSFIMHKVAVIDTVMTKILEMINEEE